MLMVVYIDGCLVKLAQLLAFLLPGKCTHTPGFITAASRPGPRLCPVPIPDPK
jgi:hypothetical protein